MLSEGSKLLVRLEDIDESTELVGYFTVLKHDEQRDIFLIQLMEVRREAKDKSA